MKPSRERLTCWFAVCVLATGLVGGQEPASPKKKPIAEPAPLGGEDLELGPRKSALERLRDKMRRAADRLDQGIADPALQDLQAEIVADLDELLKRSGPGGASGGASQAKPSAANGSAEKNGRESDETKGPVDTAGEASAAGSDATGDSTNTIKDLVQQRWGRLPDQARGALLEVSGEDFAPRYRRMIERYYRRLSRLPSTAPEPTKPGAK